MTLIFNVSRSQFSQRIVTRSLNYEKVLEYIKLKLSNRDLKPGDRIWTVASLAEKLGVGQASVREAYRILELMGVLEITRGKGTFVSTSYSASDEPEPFNIATHGQLREARLIIEPELAARAAERATDQEVQQMLDSVSELENLHLNGLDCSENDAGFHALVHQAAHNPVMQRMVRDINDQNPRGWRIMNHHEGAIEKALAFHCLIAYSIKERNPRAARYLMYQHIYDMQPDRRGGTDQRASKQELLLAELALP